MRVPLPRPRPGARRAPRHPRRGGRALAALAAAALAAAGCRKAEPPAKEAAAPAPASAPAEERFTLADLAAATRLDAKVQRVIALTGEYKMALTIDRGPRLTEHTDTIARRLDEAVPEAERALADVRDPRDRAMAQPVVAEVSRWPALLRDARAELLASPRPATRAADALSATDDEVARALDGYRAFRATWRIADSPAEPEAVLEFLRARRALEAEEAELGRALQPGGSPRGRAQADALVARAREAAAKVDEPRRASATRFVDAEAQALVALAGMGAPGAIDEQRERDALAYQIAKAGALDALAEYVALTARRAEPR